MIGQIYQLSKYQQGCRFLQKRLEEKIAPNTEIIFNELYPHLVELMMGLLSFPLFLRIRSIWQLFVHKVDGMWKCASKSESTF
jgi:hypothetical protein